MLNVTNNLFLPVIFQNIQIILLFLPIKITNIMATCNPAARTKDKEFNTVYIRISNNSKTDYIKTSMSVHKSGIKKGEIADILFSRSVDRSVDIKPGNLMSVAKESS